MVYGTRPHPKDGELIPSHEFGTSVHGTIERMINHHVLGIDEHPGQSCWDKWAMPFLNWIDDNNVQALGCEKIVSHGGIKIAGSVDFIGIKDSRIFLADYKCRVNTKGKAKRYQKDCCQLAIEGLHADAPTEVTLSSQDKIRYCGLRDSRTYALRVDGRREPVGYPCCQSRG